MRLPIKQLPAATPGGLATLDGAGRQVLAQDAIRAWQVVRAARPVLVNAGGSWSSFLATGVTSNADATDGSYEAVQGGTPAPVGGVLAGLLSTYLTGTLGQTAAQASSALQTIWANAAGLTP